MVIGFMMLLLWLFVECLGQALGAFAVGVGAGFGGSVFLGNLIFEQNDAKAVHALGDEAVDLFFQRCAGCFSNQDLANGLP